MSTPPLDGLARGSWRWYMNRATVMSPMEVSFRVATALGHATQQARQRLGVDPAVPRPRLRSSVPEPWLAAALRLPAVDEALYLREADAIARGFVERLDGQAIQLGTAIDWSASGPISEADELLDDPRYAMELHRHAHLVRLAQAWRLSGAPRYLTALLQQIDSWLLQCPYPQGIAWASALDAGLRLLNWSIVWQLIDGHHSTAIPEALRERWTASVYVHAKHIRRNLSRHSSANNHLAGELLGLVVARSTWPLWKDVVSWGNAAARELPKEALRQTHPDGVNREQASWYQVFLFELLVVLLLIERVNGRSLDHGVLRRMAAMASFIAALRDAGGQLSHHGDADHARVLQLAPGLENIYDGMLALAAALDIAPQLAPLTAAPSTLGAWLLGRAAPAALKPDPSPPRAGAIRSTLPRGFPDGGYYLLGQRFGEPDEVLITVDAGPLGYLGIAAHGHADALSLRLSVRGQPILVDRGTYVYNNQPRWRHYFRSTLAHNTVCIDGEDQSQYGGPFLWLRKARCKLLAFESSDSHGLVEATHDGYRRLARSLTHRRRVEWRAADRSIEVADTLLGRGRHEVLIAWHFDPNCVVSLGPHGATLRSADVRLRVSMAGPAGAEGQWQLHQGDAASPLGWHSPHFGSLEPAPTLVWRAWSDGTSCFTTRFSIEDEPRNEP